MAGVLDALRSAGLLKASYLERLREEEEERRAHAELAGDERAADPLQSPAALPHLVLLRLCDAGALVGSLTVELDVRPDELLGPLCAALGGSGPSVRAVDVVDGPPLKLFIHYRDHEEGWELEDLYPFVMNLNDLLKEDRQARVAAILGEWEDALQLWCVEKQRLRWLLQQPWFFPRNRMELQRMAAEPGRR
jgi:hypothetical protein